MSLLRLFFIIIFNLVPLAMSSFAQLIKSQLSTKPTIHKLNFRQIRRRISIKSQNTQYKQSNNISYIFRVPFEVIHFVLCHIYSGTFQLPDSIPIIELAAIADMLGLEGLKEAIMYKLKTSYCHNFHTVCSIFGVS